MKVFKKIAQWLVFSFVLFSVQLCWSYDVVYRQGDLPIKEKQSVTINRSGQEYVIAPSKGDGSFRIHLKDMRGTNRFKNGLWLFWYENGSLSKKAFFETDDVNSIASEIDQAIVEYNRDPNKEYEAHWKSYQEQALKEAK